MEYKVGNIFVRPNELPNIGDVLEGHWHNFDHMTLVVEGEVQITARNLQRDVLWVKRFKAGEFVLVKAEVFHEIEAVAAPVKFHCIYAHRTPQGDVVQEYNGYDDAYR